MMIVLLDPLSNTCNFDDDDLRRVDGRHNENSLYNLPRQVPGTRERCMRTITTEAWVLHGTARHPKQAELTREAFSFPDISSEEVLARPLYGCLEGNMLHALQRDPIDICQQRGEEAVVIGNAGVVVVEQIGSEVDGVAEGDTCIVFGNGVWDEQGYPVKIVAYDAPGSMGVLAKQMKLHQRQLMSPFPLVPGFLYSSGLRSRCGTFPHGPIGKLPMRVGNRRCRTFRRAIRSWEHGEAE